MEAGRDLAVTSRWVTVTGPRQVVSCIMPTCNRRRFVEKAIQYFLRQSHHPRELLIVDDGEDAVADLLPDDRRIRYLRPTKKLSLGAKRNMACRAAAGEIIVHWDDDDWMANRRLSCQVQALLESGADLCGLDRLLFYEPGTNRSWLYTYPRKETRLLSGGSLCYLKRFWKNNPFPEINLGEDTRFVWSQQPKKLLALDDLTFYVALIHPDNTNPINTAGPRWRPYDTGRIRDRIGEDWDFYQNLNTAETDEKKQPRSVKAAQIEVIRDHPLVSCIMPTSNRPLFLSQAITYFRRQKYPNKELVIVDDGTIDSGELITRNKNIRYIRLNRKATVGHKRNVAAKHSKGAIIAHWDDDDWYAPDRLQYQVEVMLKRKTQVCGLATEYFYDVSKNRYWSCLPELHARMFFADINGRSIMYAKAVWENHTRYPDISLAEDARFLKNLLKRKVRITKLENCNQLIYIRHPANAWRFKCGKHIDPSGWHLIQSPSCISSKDMAFYQAIHKDIRCAEYNADNND